MELRHLRYFVAVAERLSFSRAAVQLHLAQPSLSTQIRDLENELGSRLLDRDRNRVALTDAGAVFLRRIPAGVGQRQDGREARSRSCCRPDRRIARGHDGAGDLQFLARLPGPLPGCQPRSARHGHRHGAVRATGSDRPRRYSCRLHRRALSPAPRCQASQGRKSPPQPAGGLDRSRTPARPRSRGASQRLRE